MLFVSLSKVVGFIFVHYVLYNVFPKSPRLSNDEKVLKAKCTNLMGKIKQLLRSLRNDQNERLFLDDKKQAHDIYFCCTYCSHWCDILILVAHIHHNICNSSRHCNSSSLSRFPRNESEVTA